MKKNLFNECIAEAIGTFLFVFLGIGSVAVLIMMDIGITYWEMAMVWGISVALAIYCTAHISGGHINPAVTISMAIWNKFPFRKVIPYILAQIIGAFFAAVCIYGLYHSIIANYEKTESIVRNTSSGAMTANIFVTFPAENINLLTAFGIEFLITMILMLVIFVVINNTNVQSSGLGATIIGLTIAVCGLAFGPLTGFAMNPARDLGPRIFTLISGWGEVALGPNYYGLIIPILAPILGAIFAGVVYFKVLVPTMENKTKVKEMRVEEEKPKYI
ncbi:aquaporin [Virgibacillus pantothenticus]|uniref:MIP/aquaporin family protein n=1 Tax=Virgibacillus pantothenticus TaxID=1473 RepID=UPI001B16DDB0|nr:MIP/aquaporin family protein [Virgibacillus pantothenticus]GIP63520.1 aquaporin [Virgibacillus pantothenticus]